MPTVPHESTIPSSNLPEPTQWYRRLAIAGSLTLAVAIALLALSPRTTCGGASHSSPILLFEFVRSVSDVTGLFGTTPTCSQTLLAAFLRVNALDYAFMPAYGALLFCGLKCIQLRTATPKHMPFFTLGLIASVLAPIADAVENVFLLRFDPLHTQQFSFIALNTAVATKFVLLGCVSVVLAWAQITRTTGRSRWFALAHVPALPIVILAVASPHAFLGLLQLPFIVSWIVLLIELRVFRQTHRKNETTT